MNTDRIIAAIRGDETLEDMQPKKQGASWKSYHSSKMSKESYKESAEQQFTERTGTIKYSPVHSRFASQASQENLGDPFVADAIDEERNMDESPTNRSSFKAWAKPSPTDIRNVSAMRTELRNVQTALLQECSSLRRELTEQARRMEDNMARCIQALRPDLPEETWLRRIPEPEPPRRASSAPAEAWISQKGMPLQTSGEAYKGETTPCGTSLGLMRPLTPTGSPVLLSTAPPDAERRSTGLRDSARVPICSNPLAQLGSGTEGPQLSRSTGAMHAYDGVMEEDHLEVNEMLEDSDGEEARSKEKAARPAAVQRKEQANSRFSGSKGQQPPREGDRHKIMPSPSASKQQALREQESSALPAVPHLDKLHEAAASPLNSIIEEEEV
eukprot:gnl/TRDRNA2_/TRDRNA2_125080_c3_seq2.p1 gnl/TRDRNA2_/TRDRNA2_125080_c3~~gnl/TRDRNA2_/TRDRNA2_125080_c3_seq2.p1  ORF type:complete len:385 (-),score=73.24 gnl/TRDRNA2_/TRDRNA2_125080_c3_seq2:357-1511(-)